MTSFCTHTGVSNFVGFQVATDIFVALARNVTHWIFAGRPNRATTTPDKFRIATGSHVFEILTVVTSQSSIVCDYTPEEAVLNFIAERLSVQGVIMGKSSSFPHCKGIEGNNLCNEVIRHVVS